jgi:predicted DNA-binding WGR domain protein
VAFGEDFQPMAVTTLTRIEPARNMRRFNCLDVQPDLFGPWCCVREWGWIGRPGRVCASASNFAPTAGRL